MAKYRRDLTKSNYKILKQYYQDHYNSKDSGIFTFSKKHRLLGIKGNGKEEIKNESDFWLDVRKSVKNGIVDLKLVADVASIEQQKQMFKISKERFSIIDALHSVLKTEVKKIVKQTEKSYAEGYVYPEQNELAWKSFLSYSLARIGMEFFLENFLITSKLHKRNLEESLDVLTTEMYQFLEKLDDDQKFLIDNNFGQVWKDYLK